MSVSGQVQSIFTIEELPVGVEFQVIIDSTIRIICWDGIERGHCSKHIISRPIRLLESFDAPEVFITDWLPHRKTDIPSDQPSSEEHLVHNHQHKVKHLDFEELDNLSFKDAYTLRNNEVQNEIGIHVSENCQNGTGNFNQNNNLWKTVSINFTINGMKTEEIYEDSSIQDNISCNGENFETFQEEISSICEESSERRSCIIECEPDTEHSEEMGSRKTRASKSNILEAKRNINETKRNINETRSKIKTEALRSRKGQRHSKRKTQSSDGKLIPNRKKRKKSEVRKQVPAAEIKKESDNNDKTVLRKNEENSFSDEAIDAKEESNLTGNDPEFKPAARKNAVKPNFLRKKTVLSKSLKGRGVKCKKSQDQDDSIEINTDGLDPKLIYAKKSLEKQNLKNANRIRVELENYTDKFRTTIVESLAQKDRGKSFEEKSYQSYECTICGRFQSAVQEKIRFHIEQHINGELECKKCGYILSYRKEISRHNSEAHTADVVNKRVCELCGMTASNYRSWKAHMSKVHKVPSFKCKHCPEKFFNAAEVVVHTKETHKDIILPCDKCGQIFVSRGNWSYHSVRCNGTANSGSFVCDQCGKNLITAIALKRHIRHNHEMEKTHKCNFCSYATHTIARLQKHVNAHLGNKQYHCELCQFSCVQKYQLTSHMRTHNGEKPFRCDQCPYAVAWNVQLKAHKKIHNLPSAVSCKACGVIFRDVKSLSKHEQKDHGMKSKSDLLSPSNPKSVSNITDNSIISSNISNCITSTASNSVSSNISSCINTNINNCVSSNVTNCISSNVSNDAGINQQGLFNNTMRNVSNSFHMNEILPSGSGVMNMNNNMRNHLQQLENNQMQVHVPTQVPMYSSL